MHFCSSQPFHVFLFDWQCWKSYQLQWETCLAVCFSYQRARSSEDKDEREFQECHADIRLATDHLQFIRLGGPTVVIVLAGLSTNLVTCQAQFCLGTFVTFPSPARPQDFRIKR